MVEVQIVVSGFSDDVELDQFVRSEIRYLKGFDMEAARCEGRILLFVVRDFPRPNGYAQTLRGAYPHLRIIVCAGPDDASIAVKAEEEGCKTLGELRVEEVLYETF